MNEEDLRHLLALTCIDDMGPVTINGLLRRFESARHIFRASFSDLAAMAGVSTGLASRINGFDDWKRVDEELERARRMGTALIAADDDRYPPLLRHIYDYPPLLYLKGALEKNDINVALVGSRRATAQGRFTCDRLSRDLASAGVTVVSGGARGIDSAAHQGALAAGGRTIAVMGCGIDVAYPPENEALFEKIAARGALISEYPLGTLPLPHHFPRRNRIISGMSYGIVVVEAAEKSGSLITARMALEQGRDVFAIPGSIESHSSRGTNSLIKSGARLVQDSDDIINEIRPQVERILPSSMSPEGNPSETPDIPERPESAFPEQAAPPAEKPQAHTATEDQQAILNLLGTDPVHLDQLVSRTDESINRLLDLLLSLEMTGRIRQLPGRYFVVKE